MVHPRASTLALRGLRTPPFHERQRAMGAVFGEANGWERPLWFASNAGLPGTAAATRDEWSSQHWSPIAAAEAHATRNAVAVFDMSALARLEVSGPGATDFLRCMLSTDVDKSVGTVVYGLLLDTDGGVVSDVTVARLGAERYHLGVNGHLDHAWLAAHAPAGGAVQVRDVASGACGLGLWGPRARDVLARLTDADVSHRGFGFYRAREIRVAGVAVLAMRLSYVGELGWELYTPAEFGSRLWDSLFEAGRGHGIVPAGRRAFESLRLENGYRLWGTDMTREDSPEEAGVGFAVRAAGRDFLGRAALATRALTRRLTCLTLDDPDRVVLGSEPVYRRGSDDVVGYVTSADHGYTTGVSIVYAWPPPELAQVGVAVEVDYFTERLAATVTAEPIFDPEMKHLRC